MNEITSTTIRSLIPQFEKAKPAEHLSDKYVFIPTDQIIKDIMAFGWQPGFNFKESRFSIKGRHSFEFTRPDFVQVVSSGDKVYPRIIIYNSYDGTCAFRIYAGLFRLICSNGLALPVRNANFKYSYHRIRHIHYNLETLNETLEDILQTMESSIQTAKQLNTVDMSEDQMDRYARFAFMRRMQVPELEMMMRLKDVEHETVAALLKSVRPQDSSNTAWAVWNRLQEKVVEKGFNVSYPDGSIINYRKLTNTSRLMDLNISLFNDLSQVIGMPRQESSLILN